MLPSLITNFVNEIGVRPVVATEIECYLLPEIEETLSLDHPLWEAFKHACSNARIPLLQCEQERGVNQFELSLLPSSDIQAIITHTNQAKQLLEDKAWEYRIRVNFEAKPYPDQPGSALHIHIHLEDAEGANLYYKQEDTISLPLMYSLGGLIATMPEAMPFFAPYVSAYQRYKHPQQNAPLTVSWGTNNRTVALRLPDKGGPVKHIEHRVPAADADIQQAITAVIIGVHYGLTEQVEPPAPIYGDASLPMYTLPPLPQSLDEAKDAYQYGSVIQFYGIL